MHALLNANWKGLLWSRAARNVYFWAAVLYVAFGLNTGNDARYHYGIIRSPWYVPVMLASLALQCALVYTNNLWLVPRFLVKRRRAAYAAGLAVLVAGTSILTVVLMKAAAPHINIDELQHPGFTTTDISADWTPVAIFSEAQTFVFSALVWVAIFTLAWYAQDYRRQQAALRLSEQQRIEAELRLLKAQINPHFLFNTLNNIYGLSLQKSDAAPEAIFRLSSLLRYMLYESSAPLSPFSREKAAIEAYVEIEALRLPDDAGIALTLEADHDYDLPPLLWLPLFENVFKHGTRLVGTPVDIAASFVIERGIASIRTRNNYAGDAGAGEAAGGIGLANLEKRLRLLYPGRYTFRTSGNGHSFEAILSIQL